MRPRIPLNIKSFKVLSIAIVPLLLLGALALAAPVSNAGGAAPAALVAPPAPAAPPAPPPPPEPRRHRQEPRAWLGIVLSEDDEEEGEVTISSVSDDSPASEAGLRKGDRILEIDGHKVGSSNDVVRSVRAMDPGDDVKIRIERNGQEKTVTATLGDRPAMREREFEFFTPEAPRGHGHGDEPGMWFFGESRPMLGVEIHPMSEDLRSYFKAPRNAGLLVNRVMEDTPAEKAGLKAGDVIVEVDGQEVSEAGDIGRALRDHEPGDKVPVKVVRDGSERTLDVTLDERAGRKRRGSLYMPGMEGMVWKDQLTDEQREEIHRSMEQAREAMEKSMRELHEQLRQQREQVKEQQIDVQRQQQELQRQIRDEIRRSLRDRDRAVHVNRVVSYDI